MWSGDIGCLYQGAAAAAAATAVGYFPWFLTFNYLNGRLKKPSAMGKMLLRNAAIGLAASISSDMCSNSIRVLKTTKQAAAAYDANVTYRRAAALVIEADGWKVCLITQLVCVECDSIQFLWCSCLYLFTKKRPVFKSNSSANRSQDRLEHGNHLDDDMPHSSSNPSPVKIIPTSEKHSPASTRTPLPSPGPTFGVSLAQGLMGRGLTTRILANGLQSMLFTVVWRYLHEKYIVPRREAAALQAKGARGDFVTVPINGDN